MKNSENWACETHDVATSFNFRKPNITNRPYFLISEVEKKLNNHERTTSGRFARNSARKSRISESFYDAQERLEDVRLEDSQPSTAASQGQRVKLEFLEEAPNETIITFADLERTPMGVEVSGMFENPLDPSTQRPEATLRLTSVQITKIEPDGRVGRDGRLKVGDKILAIDGRPVSQVGIFLKMIKYGFRCQFIEPEPIWLICKKKQHLR